MRSEVDNKDDGMTKYLRRFARLHRRLIARQGREETTSNNIRVQNETYREADLKRVARQITVGDEPASLLPVRICYFFGKSAINSRILRFKLIRLFGSFCFPRTVSFTMVRFALR